eukprot:712194-Rhodomonas_salina.1
MQETQTPTLAQRRGSPRARGRWSGPFARCSGKWSRSAPCLSRPAPVARTPGSPDPPGRAKPNISSKHRRANASDEGGEATSKRYSTSARSEPPPGPGTRKRASTSASSSHRAWPCVPPGAAAKKRCAFRPVGSRMSTTPLARRAPARFASSMRWSSKT